MPEPILYLKANAAAVLASTAVLLAAWGCKRCSPKSPWAMFIPLGIAVGLVAGYYVQGTTGSFPPRNALDRLLMVILPVVLAIELAGLIDRLPRWGIWVARLSLAAVVPRVLFHDSVYLSGASEAFPFSHSLVIMLVGGSLLMGNWALLVWLSRRTSPTPVSIALQLAVLSAGAAIMMSGYIKGGAASLPLFATAATVIVGSWLLATSSNSREPLIGISVVSLFSLLFIGVYFGELSLAKACVILFATQLLWVTELPKLRKVKPIWKTTIGLLLVALVLLIVLVLAKQQFDSEMAPLLS